MTTPTAQETALLRSRPHNTKLYLSIFQPVTVYTGYITGSVSKGTRSFQLINTTGPFTTLEPQVTVLVTSASGTEKGRTRATSLNAPAGQLIVAENSDINWANGDYVELIRFFEIWPVYPRILLVTGTTTTTWFKDYDIAYTDQNSKLGYFINMGSHYAGILKNGQHRVYYTAEGTEHVRSDETGTSYHWIFDGGTPFTSTAKTPGWVTYNNSGFFTTRLTVSGSVTGASDFSDRHISIYDPVGSTPTGTIPITQWELLDLAGSRDQGGYVASIRIFEDTSNKVIRDGSLVVIFADDYYAGTHQSIGGNSTNRSEIVFVGYVVDGTIHYNYKDHYVDFDLASPTEFMKMAEGFSVSVQDSDDPAGDAATNPDIPSGWVAVLDMTVKKAMYHYLRWHSTVLQTTDFQFIGTDQPIQYFDADRTSIYDAINTLMSGALVGKICSDRQGKIYAERDVYVEQNAFNSGLGITKRDWVGDPAIEEHTIQEVSYLEMGGIAYNGTTFSALMACAPGVTPAYRGKIQRIQGLALTNQAELNTLVGNVYARMNAKYPNIEFHLAGNYRNFDIAPQEKVLLDISQADVGSGIDITNKNFFINSMSWEYNARNETFIPTLGLTELTSGFDGDTMAIPDVPPVEGDEGGFTIPPIVIPPIELPPWPTFPTGMINFVPAISGFSPGLTAADFQVVGQIQPNYVIYFTAGNDGIAFGHTKAPSGLGGTTTVYAILEGFTAGNISCSWSLFNITQGTSAVASTQTVAIIDGINFILPLSIGYIANDIIFCQFSFNAASAVDAGCIGWSLL